MTYFLVSKSLNSEHDNDNVVLSAKCQHDLTIKMDIMDKEILTIWV